MILLNGLIYFFTPDSVTGKVKSFVARGLKHNAHCLAQKFREGRHGIHLIGAVLTTCLSDFDSAKLSFVSQYAHILEALGANQFRVVLILSEQRNVFR
ncbi:hypothetical protein D3C75_1093560 [compost metagenome]